MQEVSQAWKDAQRRTLVPASHLEITIGVGDPEAQFNAKGSDNGHESFSNVQSTANESKLTPIKYATLEPGLWVLDGTYRLVGDTGIPALQQGVVGKGRIGMARILKKGG